MVVMERVKRANTGDKEEWFGSGCYIHDDSLK